jgi:NAD(P)-dependent dehydrogenase (short-subunit alcohol dehydrogenase family)
MILENKNGVIYGAGGAIGSAVAKAFAKEGANVFLTGRKMSRLESVAQEIEAAGGRAETAIVDALKEEDIHQHLQLVTRKFGSIDISFNAIGISQTGVQGIALTQLTQESFLLPVITYSKSHFLTATAAAKFMIPKNKGVILTLTATPVKIAARLVGGMAAAWSAIESLTRTLAGELGSSGIRVVCLRADGMPETDTITEVFALHAKGWGMSSNKEFQSLMESITLLKRLPKLEEVANAAVFIASDQAGAITGTTVNLSCGSVVD